MEGERPTPDHAARPRRVLLVRLAAWGAVLVLAVVAFNVRAGASDPDQGANGEQRNGTTSQGEGIWVVTGGDRVQEVGLTWEFACSDGSFEKVAGTFRARDLHRDGRSFWSEDEGVVGPEKDGWVEHVRSEVRGTAAPSGALSGTAAAELWLERGVERRAICRSGRVHWSIPASSPASATGE